MTENGFSFDLSGKTALVTGAASGLGAATARVLAGRASSAPTWTSPARRRWRSR